MSRADMSILQTKANRARCVTRDIKKELEALKRKLIKRIEMLIQPYLYDSGYMTGMIGKSRPLRLFRTDWEMDDGTMVWAVTEYGVITECWGHGSIQEGFHTLGVETLLDLVQKIEEKAKKSL